MKPLLSSGRFAGSRIVTTSPGLSASAAESSSGVNDSEFTSGFTSSFWLLPYTAIAWTPARSTRAPLRSTKLPYNG